MGTYPEPFGPDNLMTGGLPGQPTERELYDAIINSGRCAREVLTEIFPVSSRHPETYHQARILAALCGDDQAIVDAHLAEYRRRRLEYQHENRPTASGKSLVKSWSPGRPHGVTLAEEDGYALVRTKRGHEVWRMCDTQLVGPDPDVMRRATKLRVDLDQQLGLLARHNADGNEEMAQQARERVRKLRELIDHIEQVEAWAWCKEED